MQVLKQALVRSKPYLGSIYHLTKRAVKKVDKIVVRVLSFGKYFKPKKISAYFLNLSLPDRLIFLRNYDMQTFAAYNESTNPNVILRLYSLVKNKIRKVLAYFKNRLKEALR